MTNQQNNFFIIFFLTQQMNKQVYLHYLQIKKYLLLKNYSVTQNKANDVIQDTKR